LEKELGAALALIDERKARLLADSQSINVIGSDAVVEMGYPREYVVDLRKTY
jgi:predicted nucleic acid-binding protein